MVAKKNSESGKSLTGVRELLPCFFSGLKNSSIELEKSPWAQLWLPFGWSLQQQVDWSSWLGSGEVWTDPCIPKSGNQNLLP